MGSSRKSFESVTGRPEVTSGKTCKMPGCGTSPLMTPQKRNKRNKCNRSRELAGFRRKMLRKPRKTSATDPQRAQQMVRMASATALLSSTESNTVADVADVALVRGNGGEAPSDDLAIPAFLDRNRKQDPDRLCPLGPGGDGDSLDDLQ